jgi:hypothetical protein
MRRSAILAALLAAGVASAQEGWDEARVAKQVEKVKGSDTEAWKRLPWVPSLVEAKEAARKEGRPVFLFTLDGNLDTGRC